MWEILKGAVLALFPSLDNDPMIQYRWRIVVASIVIVLLGVDFVSMAWAQGMIPHMAGVATTDDLATMRRYIKEQIVPRQDRMEKTQVVIQLILIRQTLKQVLHDRCLARENKNQQALDAANQDLDIYTDRYRQLTGYSYNVPSCDEVLITAPQ